VRKDRSRDVRLEDLRRRPFAVLDPLYDFRSYMYIKPKTLHANKAEVED
jgi:hypothetical protein